MNVYKVWVRLNGKSAQNAGIIYGSSEPARKDGWWYCEVQAGYDDWAFRAVSEKFKAAFPAEKRPLAGSSYMSKCRPSKRISR